MAEDDGSAKPPTARIENNRAEAQKALADFTATKRLIPISIMAAGLGVVTAYVALALLRLIGLFTNLLYFHRWATNLASPGENKLGIAQVLVPVGGALVVGLMARFGSEKIRGHGIPEAMEAILLRGSRVEPKVALLKPISAAISIGSGGPFGAEGPIIMTGGAIGSIFAQMFRLTNAERKTLLVAGAAAGMSAVFASPIAGALLAVELLLFEWKPRSFVPVALASAAAAATRPLLLGEGPIFHVPMHTPHFGAMIYLCACACGLTGAMLSGVLTASVYFFEDAFKKLPMHWMWWPALGGLVIGLGGLYEPRALGVGYETIEATLRGELLGKVLLSLVVVKAVIWSVSLGSGTSGGVLAPLLMMGAALGALESRVLPMEGAGFWALISMAAVLAGTMRSPLTSVIFAVEITHDYGALVPLLVACATAHGFSAVVLKRSILTEKVVRRGYHVSREYATDPLELLFVREVIVLVTDVCPVLTADDLKVTAHPNEPLNRIAYRMAKHGRTELIVVTEEAPHGFVGRITLSDLLKARTRHAEEEERRERHLPITFMIPRFRRGSAASIPPPT